MFLKIIFSVLRFIIEHDVFLHAADARSVSSLSSLPDTHQMLKDSVREFVEREVKPNAATWDKQSLFPQNQVCLLNSSKPQFTILHSLKAAKLY